MTGVAGDTIYRVSVRAHNDAGDSPWSDELEIMRRLAPSTPTDASVSVGEADIVLSWSAPAIGAPDGYHVEYGELDSNERATEFLPATQTSFTHSGNIEGVTYRYRVRAHNAAGESPWSDTITASRTLAPPAPTGLTTEVSGSLITLSWTAPTTGIVDSYEVEYGVLDSGETSTSTIEAAETGFEHIGAQGDVTHRYRVRSVNSAGHSPWADPVEAIWIMQPGVPTNVNADTDGDDILVSWNRPDSVFLDEYHLEHRQYNTQDWTRTVVAEGQTSHRHIGPAKGEPPTSTGSGRSTPLASANGHSSVVSRGQVRHRRTAGAVHLHPHRNQPDTGQVDRVAHTGHPALPAPPQRGRRRLDRGQHPEAETLPLRQLDHGTGVPRVPDPLPQGRAVRRLVAGLPGLRRPFRTP